MVDTPRSDEMPKLEVGSKVSDPPISWPDPSIDVFPEDLVAVLDHEPLSPALRISKSKDELRGEPKWQIEHPTRVEVRNLEELINEPEEVMAALEARFSQLGTIVGTSDHQKIPVDQSDMIQYRVEDLWLDNFGLEGLFTISFAEERSADAACMLGVVGFLDL